MLNYLPTVIKKIKFYVITSKAKNNQLEKFIHPRAQKKPKSNHFSLGHLSCSASRAPGTPVSVACNQTKKSDS